MRHHGEPFPLEAIATLPQAAQFIDVGWAVAVAGVDVHLVRRFEGPAVEKVMQIGSKLSLPRPSLDI